MTYKGQPLEKVQYPTKRNFFVTKLNLLFSMATANGNLLNSIKIYLKTNFNTLNAKSSRIVRSYPLE